MTDEPFDPLTQTDTEMILKDLIEAAGADGIEKEELHRQFDIAAQEIREAATYAALYSGFASRELRISVSDGQVVYELAEVRDEGLRAMRVKVPAAPDPSPDQVAVAADSVTGRLRRGHATSPLMRRANSHTEGDE